MAKKPSARKNGRGNPSRSNSPITKVTAVRRTTMPRPQTRSSAQSVSPSISSKKPITHAQIAERAYFISISGSGGSEQENWHRAERELRGQK